MWLFPDPDPIPDADILKSQVAALAADCPIGQPCEWTNGLVRIRLTGFSRVNPRLPQPCQIIVSTPTDEKCLDGMETSWNEITDAARELADDWETYTNHVMTKLIRGQEKVDESGRELRERRRVRNGFVRDAIAAGITPYQIAKRLGISQPAVAKIAATHPMMS